MSHETGREQERLRQLRLLTQIGFQNLAHAADQAVTNQAAMADLLGGEVGLRAHRHNGHATAQKVIANVFPTVQAMLGDEALQALARELWWTHPPTSGDLANWGADLVQQLAQHPALASWPYLPDVARLEWARHECERAADAAFDGESLSRLAHDDPAQLRLQLKSGTAVISSNWPVVRLFDAHQATQALTTSDDAETWLGLREAIEQHQSETALVWRHHWRAEVRLLSPDQAKWMQALLDGATLQVALDAMPPEFDFTSWLTQALQSGWIWRVEPV